MKLRKKILTVLLSILLLREYQTHAQVAVNFSPAIYGQSLEGLAYARILNSSQAGLSARVTIRVRANGSNVLTVIVAPFLLTPGLDEINKAAFNNARFTFGDNNYGLTARQTGKFLEGDYEYCFEVDVSDSKDLRLPPVFENCFFQQLKPRTPLLLINPVDGDEFCNKRPQFIWQPPIPLPVDARFRLVLTEVRDKQDIVEAITYNAPVVNHGSIVGNTLFYPSNAPELKEGQKYAWQVVVYAAQAILARSDVCTFTLKCQQPQKEISGASYRELKESEESDFYIACNYLRFSINNPYGAGDLYFSIVSMEEPNKPIKGLPNLKVTAGLNKYDIDLSEIKAFKPGKEYLLIVRLLNRNLRLRFIYKNE